MNNDYLWDRTGEPDAEVQELEDVLGTLRYQPRPFALPAELRPARRHGFFPALAIAATIALMVLAAGIWLRLSYRQTSSPEGIANAAKEGERAKPSVVPTRPSLGATQVNTDDPDRGEVALQRNATSRRNRGARNSTRHNSTFSRDELSAAQRAEGEAGKEQLMLALRVVSAKLNLAQRKIPTNNNIRNQHKLG